MGRPWPPQPPRFWRPWIVRSHFCKDGYMWQCRVLAVMESILVCVLCLPLPSLHLSDFFETFKLLILFGSFFMKSVYVCNTQYTRIIAITAAVIALDWLTTIFYTWAHHSSCPYDGLSSWSTPSTNSTCMLSHLYTQQVCSSTTS